MIEKDKNKEIDSSILELVYDDANESVEILRKNLNSINTKLSLLIGFNATFVTLLSRLPNQTAISVDVQQQLSTAISYPQAYQMYKLIVITLNWLLLIKPLVLLLIIGSILLAISSILPSPVKSVILPSIMLKKGVNQSEEKFRTAIILNRDKTIKRLQELVNKKAEKLEQSLRLLAGAAAFIALDILAM
jgi:hypothetical protein